MTIVLVLSLLLSANARQAPLGLDLYRPVPADNPLTQAKIALGRRLFFDRRLSRDAALSCATCHDPSKSFANHDAVAVGFHKMHATRNVPTLVNRAYGTSFFWEGRALSLEDQAVQPLLNPIEMNATRESIVAYLQNNASYRSEFRRAFSREVQFDDVPRAIASFVRTIRSGGSPYDRYLSGNKKALSPEAREGLTLFRGKAHCSACHAGPNLSDEDFHNTGVAFGPNGCKDSGRMNVTHKAEDLGAFKTATLREVARTGPYMHDGSLTTLGEVIDYYDRGGNPANHRDPLIKPLHLSPIEKKELAAFLQSLSGAITSGY